MYTAVNEWIIILEISSIYNIFGRLMLKDIKIKRFLYTLINNGIHMHMGSYLYRN